MAARHAPFNRKTPGNGRWRPAGGKPGPRKVPAGSLGRQGCYSEAWLSRSRNWRKGKCSVLRNFKGNTSRLMHTQASMLQWPAWGARANAQRCPNHGNCLCLPRRGRSGGLRQVRRPSVPPNCKIVTSRLCEYEHWLGFEVNMNENLLKLKS